MRRRFTFTFIFTTSKHRNFLPIPPPRVPHINPCPSSSDRSTITKAVLITAASTVVVAAVFFFFLHKCAIARRRWQQRNKIINVENTLPPIPPPATVETTLAREGLTRFEGNLKGLIIDENGLDVLYWRNLQRGSGRRSSPPVPRGSNGGVSSRGQVKLKPLHWDKVNPDSVHSMVWDKIDRGSFSVDGELMEALFGYVAVGNNTSPANPKPTSPRQQIFILDPRKSQNSAIVLKSLGITREELVEALMEGHDLAAETLERLARIAPTKEEQTEILAFHGDVAKLAEAESFLFRLLNAVPTAFARVNAFLFKANYYPEIDYHSISLQTLDFACKELRSCGLFVKLLEAIFKAGNRMNARTARGNARAFNLTALLKLADVKSVDGKTTLLNFVVEEVVRSEGKRCVLNRRSNSITRSNTPQAMSKEEQEKEFLKLGLPIVGGLSSEFSNVKKAASVDYLTVVATCSALEVRAKVARKVIAQCEGERFVEKMMTFLDSVEEEVKTAREEERRVMELVKRTTEYYQAGGSVKGKDPLHLFGIVRDFLVMVDKVCLDVTRSLQRRNNIASSGSPSRQRTGVKFPVLPPDFMSNRSWSDSGESDFDM